jgi:hypothetical protein
MKRLLRTAALKIHWGAWCCVARPHLLLVVCGIMQTVAGVMHKTQPNAESTSKAGAQWSEVESTAELGTAWAASCKRLWASGPEGS